MSDRYVIHCTICDGEPSEDLPTPCSLFVAEKRDFRDRVAGVPAQGSGEGRGRELGAGDNLGVRPRAFWRGQNGQWVSGRPPDAATTRATSASNLLAAASARSYSSSSGRLSTAIA